MDLEKLFQLLSVIVALVGLYLGFHQFLQVQRFEAARPYLEKKLYWCEQAVETAAAIASYSTPPEEESRRFRQLYWGVMNMIEEEAIEKAMVSFNGALELGPHDQLTVHSRNLAYACREELARDWSSHWQR